jgi:hypothetical protein
VAFFAITACALAISVSFETAQFLGYAIVSRIVTIPIGVHTVDNKTVQLTDNYTYYYYTYTSFGASKTFNWVYVAQSLFRDLVLMILMIALNMLILFEIKKTTLRRVHMANGSTRDAGGFSNSAQQQPVAVNQNVTNSLRAQNRKVKMIVLTGLNYFIGHFCYIIYIFIQAVDSSLFNTYFFSPVPEWLCFKFVSSYILLLSYATSFFL